MDEAGDESTAMERGGTEPPKEVDVVVLDDIKAKSDETITRNSSLAASAADSNVLSTKKSLESEYLYLITKHLKSIEEYANIGCQLEDIISKRGVLGQSYNWDGSSRPARMEDLDKKFSSVPNSQLLDLLNHMVSRKQPTATATTTGKSLSSSASSSNSSAPVTILKPVDDMKRFKGRTSLDRELPLRFIDDTSNLRACQHEIKEKRFEMVRLTKALADIEAMSHVTADENILNGSNGSVNRGDDDTTMDFDIQILGDKGSYDILTGSANAMEESKSETSKITYKANSNISTKAAGIHRRQRGIQQVITDLEKKETSLIARRDASRNALLASDSMVSQFKRGWFNTNRLDWLNNRTLGISPSSVACPVSTEAESTSFHVGRANTCKFHQLYSISCHGYNPAYCAVFDKTGRFLITGADDYLVKVFDVERGLLLYTCRGHMGFVTFVAVSPDNSLFATSCVKGTIRIWRLKDGACLKVVKHNESINTLKFDTWTGALVSGGDDGVCKIWVC